jgi:hypothetical protein
MIMRILAAALLIALATVLFAGHPSNANAYVIRDSDITYMMGKGMPAEKLKAIQSRFGESFFWARYDGRIYVARDARTIREALDVLQLNLQRGPVMDRRLAAVVRDAIRRGAAKEVKP